MKKVNFIIITLLLSLSFILSFFPNDYTSAKAIATLSTDDYYTPSLASKDIDFEIDIQNDGNLTDYGLPGAGTKTDPYRIENLRISTLKSEAIVITNTTKYIVVQNCSIYAPQIGLAVINVVSGTVKISNNTVHGIQIGVMVGSCDDIVVTNNIFERNFESFHMYSTNGIEISFNTFRNNDYGIRTYNSEGNYLSNIHNNNFYGNDNGISCDSDLKDFNIHNNTFLNNELAILISSRYEINDIYCNITYNLIENSTVHGIRLARCIETVIHHNTLANNNLNDEGTSQARHNTKYENVFWYDKETKEGNYWSDWSGILAYKIEGDAESKDKYPLSKPTREVQTEIPSFFVGRVVLNATVIPLTVIILGVIIYIFIKRVRKIKQ